MRTVTLICSLFILLMNGTAMAAELQLSSGVPTITTQGDAKVDVKPDTFTIVADINS